MPELVNASGVVLPQSSAAQPLRFASDPEPPIHSAPRRALVLFEQDSYMPSIMRAFCGVLASVVVAAIADDPFVLQFPDLPGLLTAEGYSGGILGHGYDPLLGESRAAITPPTFTHYDGGANLFQDPLTEQIFKYPDSILVAAYSQTSSVTVSLWLVEANRFFGLLSF
jgi:hypothetical protein